MKIGVFGGGSWGTALAILWARQGQNVVLYARNPDEVARMKGERQNARYLPGLIFPENLFVTSNLEQAINESQLLCLAVPLQSYRDFLYTIHPSLRPDHELLMVSKGIELNTLFLPAQIVGDVLGFNWEDRAFTLSGPSFALEVAKGKPTTVVIAGRSEEPLIRLQTQLNGPSFRTYRNLDVIGVELCGAMKNVIAIANGMVTGLELGSNTQAGLITRGLSEMARLGVALGAQRETFSGLAGMGDLILTCTGALSRNLRVGIEIARGRTLEEALATLGMVAEGVQTCRAAHQLSAQLGVELPIADVVYRILFEKLSPKEALRQLMSRQLRTEIDA